MRVPEAIDTPIRTLVAVATLPAGMILLSTVAVIIALLGSGQRQIHTVYRAFADLCIWVAGTTLRVNGRHHVRGDQAYVVVVNHESNWDPPSIIAGLPEVVLRFIVKQQIMRIPIFGHALRLTGNVIVERTNTRGDVERVRKTMDERPKDVSMLFFAEGTRSRDWRMAHFKKGAFATAIRSGLPILPVAVAGTRYVWPPGFIRIRRAPVVIEVGEPIPVVGLTLDDRDALREQCEQTVRKLRERAYEHIAARGFPVPPDL